MLPRQEVPAALRRLAFAQDQVLSHEQVMGHGLTRHTVARLVDSETWRRLDRGLYLTVPVEPGFGSLAWGGLLLAGDGARLGPQASGHLYGLQPAPEPIDVLVAWERRLQSRGRWRFVRERSGVRPARSTGNPPRLPVECTVLDLAAVREPGEAVGLVTMAVQRRLTTPQRLRAQLARRERHPHRSLLADVLGDVAFGAESPIELRYLREVERAHGLPAGRRQHAALEYRTDVDYEAFGLVVELDGQEGHAGVGRFRDMRRDNRLALLAGKVTLRYGWYDLAHRPCVIAHEVASALVARGWTGIPGRCARCAAAVWD